MDTLPQDLRFAVRTLRKSPGFTLTALLTLTLGIGATAAIFTLVNAALLRPLPYPQGDRLVWFNWRSTRGTMDAVTDLEAQYWSAHTSALQAIATLGEGATNLSAGDGPAEQAVAQQVSHQFFDVLGVHPALGRDFSSEDDRPGGPSLAIISDGLWRRRFGARPDVLGRTVTLNDVAYTIIGVMPPRFTVARSGPAPVVWTPRPLVGDVHDQGHNTGMFGRLRPGVTLQQARADVSRLDASFKHDYPGYLRPNEIGMDVESYRHALGDDARTPLLVLLGAALLVLLIAAANVANLLVARQAARTGDVAVRRALGASLWRAVRQLATECLVLSVMGGVAGVLLAYWVVQAVIAASPMGLFALVGGPRPDGRVLAFCAALVISSTLFMALASAAHLRRLDVNRALREGGRTLASGTRQRLRSVLTAGEFAISLVLLAGAFLLLTSLARLAQVDSGFNPDHLWTFQAMLPPPTYNTSASVSQFEEQVSSRLRALPGVTAVSTTSNLPMRWGLNFGVRVDDGHGEKDLYIQARAISSNYFQTLGVQIRRGRGFAESDAAGSQRVAIVNETFARECCGGRAVLGATIRYGGSGTPPEAEKTLGGPVRVVGVAADTRHLGLSQPVPSTIFVPQTQMPDVITAAMDTAYPAGWVLKTRTPPSLATIQRVVSGVDPNEPVTDLQPMTERIAQSIGPQTFMSTLVGSFASLALLLAAIGLYGVIAYAVAQRRHEIGVRMALGASRGAVARMVIGQGLTLAAAGGIAGLLGAAAATRVLRRFLFGVTPLDPYVFAELVVVLIVVALAASYLPARRASRVDPAIALRN